MEPPQLVLVGLVLLLGVLGVLVPGVPGTWLVWAGVLWWALHVRSDGAWVLLASATGLLLVVQVVKWLLPPRRIQGLGVTPAMAACAGGGAVLGFVLVPVVGAVPGFMGGMYLYERRRLGTHRAAWAAVRTGMRAAGTSVLVELLACLLITAAWLTTTLI
ncbi:DUF456 domain-containing protein [Streptomyces sp. NPDC058623]|uniref:DUF456 domain-containing protein n=1 Tax=Streptomyces sp. NPDC058623 TaxID=3346563 RepID=UPI0036617D7E